MYVTAGKMQRKFAIPSILFREYELIRLIHCYKIHNGYPREYGVVVLLYIDTDLNICCYVINVPKYHRDLHIPLLHRR